MPDIIYIIIISLTIVIITAFATLWFDKKSKEGIKLFISNIMRENSFMLEKNITKLNVSYEENTDPVRLIKKKSLILKKNETQFIETIKNVINAGQKERLEKVAKKNLDLIDYHRKKIETVFIDKKISRFEKILERGKQLHPKVIHNYKKEIRNLRRDKGILESIRYRLVDDSENEISENFDAKFLFEKSKLVLSSVKKSKNRVSFDNNAPLKKNELLTSKNQKKLIRDAISNFKESLEDIKDYFGISNRLFGDNYFLLTKAYEISEKEDNQNKIDQKISCLKEVILSDGKRNGKDNGLSAYTYNYLANIYFSAKEYGKAHKYYNHSITILEKIHSGSFFDLGLLSYNLGELWMKSNLPDIALDFYIKSSIVFAKDEKQKHTSRVLYKIGKVYFALGKYADAKESFQKSLEYTMEEDVKKRNIKEIDRIIRKFKTANIPQPNTPEGDSSQNNATKIPEIKFPQKVLDHFIKIKHSSLSSSIIQGEENLSSMRYDVAISCFEKTIEILDKKKKDLRGSRESVLQVLKEDFNRINLDLSPEISQKVADEYLDWANRLEEFETSILGVIINEISDMARRKADLARASR